MNLNNFVILTVCCLTMIQCSKFKDKKTMTSQKNEVHSEIIDFIKNVPGPAPWYLIGRPSQFVYYGQSTEWAAMPQKSLGKYFYLHSNQIPILIVEMYSVVYPLSKDSLMIASDLKSTQLRLTIIDLKTLSKIENIEEACAAMEKSDDSFYLNGSSPNSISIPLDLKKGSHQFKFSGGFAKTLSTVILLHNYLPSKDSIKHQTAIYELLPRTHQISVAPQDWFDSGDYDFGYQWPTRIARYPLDNRLYGDGIRLGIFKLSDDGTKIDQWLIQDHFYY